MKGTVYMISMVITVDTLNVLKLLAIIIIRKDYHMTVA